MVGEAVKGCGLAIALTMLVVGPASALEADCLWRNIVPADRAALEGAIAAGPTVAAAYDLEGIDGRAWRNACGVRSDTREQALVLLAGFVLEKSALSGIDAAVPGASEKLRSGWTSWDPADRDRIVRLGAMLARQQTPPQSDWETIRPLVTRVSKELGLTDKAQLELLLTFITGRAIRASLEGG